MERGYDRQEFVPLSPKCKRFSPRTCYAKMRQNDAHDQQLYEVDQMPREQPLTWLDERGVSLELPINGEQAEGERNTTYAQYDCVCHFGPHRNRDHQFGRNRMA